VHIIVERCKLLQSNDRLKTVQFSSIPSTDIYRAVLDSLKAKAQSRFVMPPYLQCGVGLTNA
jgi:hypothetical protein